MIKIIGTKYSKRNEAFHFSGEPGLVDWVLALHAGSRGVESHRGHMSERFFRSNRPGYPPPLSSELEIVLSEWRSVIAVSLNVGGGVRLIKPPNCTCARKTLQTQRGRTHGAGCVRQWFCTAEPLGERRYENWNTHTHTQREHSTDYDNDIHGHCSYYPIMLRTPEKILKFENQYFVIWLDIFLGKAHGFFFRKK